MASGAPKAKKFGSKTTAQEVVSEFSAQVTGRTFLITGAASGIGFEAARALASAGGKVTVAARSQEKAEKAVEEIRKALGPEVGPKADLSALELDLASLESVRKGAAAFLKRVPKLNVLINNAGVMASPYSETKDGLEQQFGVNHVAHFLLTELLMPALVAAGTPFVPSRVVNLSSMANFIYTDPAKAIDFDNLYPTRAEGFKRWTRYGESKLMNIMHATELNKRCAARKDPVVAFSLHPGGIAATKLMRYFDLTAAIHLMQQTTTWWGMYALTVAMSYKNIPQGASTTLVCALDPAAEPGKYYHNCTVDKKWIHGDAYSPELGAKLWEATEEILKKLEAGGGGQK